MISSAPSPTTPNAKTRILIVEDELIVARDIAQQLVVLGYEPLATTARGDEAVRLATELRPDLILMDIQLDGPMDGIEAACLIRDRCALPVIFLTAFASEPALARAKTACPFGYIVKPFEDRELRMVVEVALNLHQTEARLRASEARNRLLFRAVEQSLASVVITNASGVIEYVNPQFTVVTGYTAAEVLGRTPRLFRSGEHTQEFYKELWQTISDGRDWSGEFRNRRKDGSLFWERASISPVRDEAGAITHYVGVKEDVTERKQAEDHLLQAKAELQETNAQLEVSIAQARDLAREAAAANQAKTAFLATMSHELRTPLNVINGVSATLLEQRPSESQRSALELIHRSGENLLGIIEEILDFTRLQAGKATLEEQPCELSVITFHSLRQAAERAGSKGIDVRCRIDPEVPARIIGDGRKLGQVLTNLLNNAVKFTEYGHVALQVSATRADPEHWQLEFVVQDTGIGIQAEAIERLFRPFSQADGSVTRRYGGSGLGLAISRTIAQMMGGDIAVQSRPGEGSTFRFTMRSRSAGDNTALIMAGRVPSLAGKHVLVAVAHPSHGSYLQTVLRSWGVECAVLDHGTLLPGAYGPGSAFDALVIESDALPPGLRRCWDRLHVGDGSAPVVWISAESLSIASHPDARSRTLTWPVAPDELKRGVLDLLQAPADGAPTAGASAPKHEPLGRRMPLRILAADDVRINRDVLRMMLRHLAYDAEFVENGREVLEALAHRSFDLILLDVQMPMMDGISAAREIRRMFAHSSQRPRLVAITANALPESRQECLSAGMDDYLPKPVVPKQLESCIIRLFSTTHEAAEPVVVTASHDPLPHEAPWVDRDHVAAITAASSANEARELVSQLVTSFQNDYHALMPRLRHACRDRDARAATQFVHGLKGGSLTLGWSRFADVCVRSLSLLRAGTFADWDRLPEDLDNHFAHSESATEELLAHWVCEPATSVPAPEITAARSQIVSLCDGVRRLAATGTDPHAS